MSDYRNWDQLGHATDWLLIEDNVGEYMSIDETAPSCGDLYTFLSNKAGHGRRGTVAAAVLGTRSEDLAAVFSRIPEERRDKVREVTMDFSESMYSAVRQCFPRAEIVVDCFHVIQLATSALSEIRMAHKREAMLEQARARKRWRSQQKAKAKRAKEADRKRKEQGKGKSSRGRKPDRKNKAYTPPKLENGDTVVELLTRSRYFIGQSRDKWTESQRKRAKILFELYPDMMEAYNLVNGLRNIFKNKQLDKTAAAERLNLWYQEVKSAGFEQLIAVAETIESREDHVTNYFNNRHTNAAAESLNAKIKAFRSLLHGVSDRPFFMYRIATIFG